MRAALALVTIPATLVVGAVIARADTCVPDFRAADLLRLDTHAVQFCDDKIGDKRQCFAVDLATGKLAPAHPSTDLIGGATTLKLATKSAKVCVAGGSCKTLVPKARIDPGLQMHGTARGERAALINMAQVETFDAKTGARLAQFTAGKGDCTDVAILAPDLLLVKNVNCGSDDGGTSFFATAKGKQIAAVPIPAAAAHATGTTVAFVSVGGDEIVVMEGPTGKVVKRVAIGKPASDVFPSVVGDANRVVVVYGRDRAGDVAVVDLATDKVRTFAAKRCP